MAVKYRRLRLDELEELEKEFVEFLAVQSITATEWESIKTQDKKRSDHLIDLFSDIVMDKVIDKITCLQFRDAKDWKVFLLKAEEMELIGLTVPEDSDLDLTGRVTSDELIEQGVEVFQATKAYELSRNQEVFQMIDQGAHLAEEELYTQMRQLLGE